MLSGVEGSCYGMYVIMLQHRPTLAAGFSKLVIQIIKCVAFSINKMRTMYVPPVVGSLGLGLAKTRD